MIVNKPISVKIGNLTSRLTVGKPVPQDVLNFWIKTKQLDDLKKAGAIGDENKDSKTDNNKNVGNNKKYENGKLID